MTPERWQHVVAAFNAVLDSSDGDRSKAIEAVCRRDPSIRDDLERMLREHDRVTEFLDKPSEHIFGASPGEAPAFPDGFLVHGRYRVVKLLARGGMGEVYEAYDEELDTTVALKTVLHSAPPGSIALERFKREICLTRHIHHPNVCAVFDFDRHSDKEHGDVPFLTMDFQNGKTLSAHIEQSGRLSPKEALEIARQIAAGVSAAHDLGIIHRDLKPSNIMLVEQRGRVCVKITDFGLARALPQTNTPETTVTASGDIVGTPAYMAPEQFRGEATKASDIFAFGMTLYEMIAGRLPHSMPYAPRDLNERSQREYPPDIEPRWQRTIDKCLEPLPSDRFGTVQEVVDCLAGNDLQSAAIVEATKPGVLGGFSRRRWAWAAIAALLVAIGVSIVQHRRAAVSNLPELRHLAVLRIRNLESDVAVQAFCDGLLETLTSRLSQLERYQKSFWVVPSEESAGIKTLEEAYRKLNVTLAVTGSIQRLPSEVLFVVNLIDAKTRRQLNSRTVQASTGDLAFLSDRIWQGVADMIDIQLSPGIVNAITAGGTRDSAAFEYYDQGLGYVRRYGEEYFDNAINLFQKAIAKDPNYALAYAGLGEAYAKKYSMTKEARWMDLATESSKRALSLNATAAPIHMTLGQVYFRTGRHDDALAEFKRALSQDPNAVDAYFYIGKVYERQGKFPEAEQNYRALLNARPGYWLGYTGLGACYYQNGALDKAETVFRHLIEIQPDNPIGYESVGGVLIASRRYQDAVSTLKDGLKVKASADAYTNLGAAYIYLHDYENAAPAMQKAVELSPHLYDLWRNLADSYRQLPGRSSDAMNAYKTALKLAYEHVRVNPTDALAFASIGLFHARLSEPKLAQTALSRALRLNSRSSDVLFNVALAYEGLGSRQQALRYLAAANRAGFSLTMINDEPELSDLRRDPGFIRLVTRSDHGG